MRPLRSVQSELRCPEPDEDGKISAVLGKRPPTTLSVAAHGESVLLEDNYLFTSSAMRQCALRTLHRASAASLLGLGCASASPPALPPCAGMRSNLWAAASTRGARASATASLCRYSLNPALSPPPPPPPPPLPLRLHRAAAIARRRQREHRRGGRLRHVGQRLLARALARPEARARRLALLRVGGAPRSARKPLAAQTRTRHHDELRLTSAPSAAPGAARSERRAGRALATGARPRPRLVHQLPPLARGGAAAPRPLLSGRPRGGAACGRAARPRRAREPGETRPRRPSPCSPPVSSHHLPPSPISSWMPPARRRRRRSAAPSMTSTATSSRSRSRRAPSPPASPSSRRSSPPAHATSGWASRSRSPSTSLTTSRRQASTHKHRPSPRKTSVAVVGLA